MKTITTKTTHLQTMQLMTKQWSEGSHFVEKWFTKFKPGKTLIDNSHSALSLHKYRH